MNASLYKLFSQLNLLSKKMDIEIKAHSHSTFKIVFYGKAVIIVEIIPETWKAGIKQNANVNYFSF